MADDHTVQFSTFFPVTVRVEKGVVKEREYRFDSTFRIGRSPECELHFLDRSVSKHHATIQFEGRQWWVEDLGSRNGTFLNGVRIQRELLPSQAKLELGAGGPVLHLTIDYLLDSQEKSPLPPEQSPALSLPEEHRISEEAAPSPISQSAPTREPQEIPPSEEEVPSSDRPHEDQFNWPTPTPIPTVGTPSPTPNPEPGSLTQIISPILKRSSSGGAGQETMIIIKHAFKNLLKQQLRKYRLIVGVIAVMLVFLGGVTWYQHEKIQKMKAMASDIFYSMKTVELQLAQLEDTVLKHLPPEQMEGILQQQEDLRAVRQKDEQKYEELLEELGIYAKDMSVEDRTILRMARLFGECEVEMPDGFLQEVERYIKKWQSTDRLGKAIKRAKRQGYGETVTQAMLDQHMPPDFFYLALQESNFDIQAVGPRTRFGIAKGPWQFIPATAVQYGLSTGPLVEVPKYDPRDERHNFKKATRAAARYLKDLYSTEAQASGLLVMASYNWGQTRVRKLIDQLPKNPKERNFWQLLKQFKIPKQTYDYVFYIFSAAVIAKNPELFGFDFQDPLGEVKEDSQT